MRQENRRSLYKKMVVQKSGSATLVHSVEEIENILRKLRMNFNLLFLFYSTFYIMYVMYAYRVYILFVSLTS